MEHRAEQGGNRDGQNADRAWPKIAPSAALAAAPPQLVVNNFGYDAGGWRVERHPRFVVDVVGSSRPDIVGFGYDGVWVSETNGDGTFGPPQLVVNNFGYDAGGCRVEQHPRLLANVVGENHADIVGFGNDGVWVSES